MFALRHKVPGLLKLIGTIFDSGLGVVQSRIELLSVELQEEKLRLFRMIICAGVLVALGTIGLGLFALAIVFAFWESARVEALAGLTVLYLLGTLFLYRKMSAELRKGPQPFSRMIGEIKEDRKCLNNDNKN